MKRAALPTAIAIALAPPPPKLERREAGIYNTIADPEKVRPSDHSLLWDMLRGRKQQDDDEFYGDRCT